MRQLGIILVVLVAVGMSAAVATAQNPHFVGEPTCSLNNACTTVTCTGKIAGVGTEPTTVVVDIANSGCVNKPGHEPPGHATVATGPIQPRGGQITFTAGITLDCPPGLTPVFGDEALISIVQDGVTTPVDGPVDVSKPLTCPQ
jgi:hypothetical protein